MTLKCVQGGRELFYGPLKACVVGMAVGGFGGSPVSGLLDEVVNLQQKSRPAVHTVLQRCDVRMGVASVVEQTGGEQNNDFNFFL